MQTVHQKPSLAVRRVFLSSTFVDLEEHRAAVRDIIGRMGQFTLAMEQFGAREGDAQTISTDLVAGCDLYLGVMAWRYGYVPAVGQRSVTHLEYDEAGRLGIPRLVFLAAPDTQTADGLGDLFPAGARDPEHLTQLLAFRAEIERAQVVDYFTTPDDLAKKVAAALHQYLQAHPSEAVLRPPHDLPPRTPGFVGRDADLQMLCSVLREGRDEGVSAAIVDMGGLGKSSLAGAAMHLLAAPPAFPGGMTWLRCDDRVGSAGLCWVEDQLLAAWGASLPADVTARATTPEDGLELRERALRDRLRPSASVEPAPALVLLDNVERELPLPRLLETVTPLGITTLLTSRIEPSSPRVRLDALAQHPCIRLFVERYTARGGTWTSERDEVITREIVDALGGLPLAIELAAARAARTGLPLAALAEELRAPEALARLGDPLDPSASVRYSLGKTLAALSPSQWARFAALGLLEGPDWPRQVIEALFTAVSMRQPEDAPEGPQSRAAAQTDLEALLAFSLARLATVEVAGTQTPPRVRLHPLVRELAREQWAGLSGADQESALHALLVGLQDWLATFFKPSAYQQLALDEYLIAGALRTAAARQVDLPLLISIVKGWGLYLSSFRTRLDLEMQTLQLASARTIGDRPTELDALHAVGSDSSGLGRGDEALRYWHEGLALAREWGDRVQIIPFLCDVGGRRAKSGSRAEAEQMYEEANTIARELGNHLTDWSALVHLAVFARTLGRWEEAETWYGRGLETARATGNRVAELKTFCDLGLMFAERRDYGRAHEHLEEGLVAAYAFGDPIGIGVLLTDRGHVELLSGELEAAGRDLTQALPLLTPLPERALEVRANLAILAGLQAQQQGDRDAAEQALEQAKRLFEQSVMPEFAEEIRYVHQLLAELQKQPVPVSVSTYAGAPSIAAEPASVEPAFEHPVPSEPVIAGVATSRARRRWWPWSRRS